PAAPGGSRRPGRRTGHPVRAADRGRRPGDQPGRAPGEPGRRRGPSHSDRVRPPGPSGPATAGGAAPRAAPRRRLGLGRRSGGAHRRQPREGLARQARRRPDPDGARCRLRPGRAAPVTLLARLTARLPRPLDPVRSIKLKLGLLVCVSGAIGLSYFWLIIGRIPPVTSIIAIGLALLSTYVLAHGMTRPLREMTAAARAMARGDYSRRTRATSRDEVGELASAFNQMSADLAAADQHRRELIANVSHELRTPITALHGVLENIVDGVAEADPATLRTALAQTERLSRLVAELLDL